MYLNYLPQRKNIRYCIKRVQMMPDKSKVQIQTIAKEFHFRYGPLCKWVSFLLTNENHRVDELIVCFLPPRSAWAKKKFVLNYYKNLNHVENYSKN